MYPIVGLKYISGNSANMDWDFIVTVLSCVWTTDGKCFVTYEWPEGPSDNIHYNIGIMDVYFFNSRFEKFKEQ